MFFLNFLCVDYYYGYYCCDDYWYGSGWAIAVYVFLGLICISIIICCIVPIQFTTIIFHLTTISYVWASQKSFLHHICHYFCKLKRCRPLLPARTTAAPSMTPWSSRPPSKLPSLALPVRVNTRSFFSCQNKFHRAFSVVSTHNYISILPCVNHDFVWKLSRLFPSCPRWWVHGSRRSGRWHCPRSARRSCWVRTLSIWLNKFKFRWVFHRAISISSSFQTFTFNLYSFDFHFVNIVCIWKPTNSENSETQPLNP